ncbi:hypothetical protein B0A58_11645 [Flavobacterium branchiophilum NBRC 15030 = ATCC 35035]|uniref:AAA domain-containing protein n=1 Tax=Flavobacterium branchiophilum TaxID=55197 RepID=A0A543G5T9_9FLAO|nr:AAA family ATPase [Flavobacterium branchiophilum]OXA73570.1 hypothetical protein B0A58_11645 [Flavobacterium branchiophilum NBRC 15030 = ATCC 35035]TQM41449.1 AAA domain-containing protein [Flavobacterium branchiophilum]GEM55337.1 hypothetical protein FB1_15580 [Flavobacterium branchiophilum NBRC 15030 = ATCC 35035]
MLKINNIKIDVNTNNGLFGTFHTFKNGLNIIRGNNTSGKSSLFQAIVYALGFEELIGGRFEKTMQSVLKDQVEYPKNTFHSVLQSFVLLEIENANGDIITIRRFVQSPNRKSQLIDVYYGSLLANTGLESRPMFIHDNGGASDENYGFHLYLEEFLNWQLPKVLTNKGDLRKIYIQQIASSFIIEQKSGWSDFFATMPIYGLNNKEARIVEFILDLDVYDNKMKKQELSISKRILENDWLNLKRRFDRFKEKGGGKLIGLSDSPMIINNLDEINIQLSKDKNDYSISNYLDIIIDEFDNLNQKETVTVKDKINDDESLIVKKEEQLIQTSFDIEMLSSELTFDKQKISNFNYQLENLTEDLRKNKGALKVQKMGAEINLKVSQNNCPTCSQEINDSLLPLSVKQVPMRLEDNINFLSAQIKMLEVNIESLELNIVSKDSNINKLRVSQNNLRSQIRELKKELTSDDRLPSIVDIEYKLNLKKRIEFYSRYLEDFAELKEELSSLSNKWKKILEDQEKLKKDTFSPNDISKLKSLSDNFKSLLSAFNYSSKAINDIAISDENYLPLAKKPNDDLVYNIRFDSSASDFVRSIWAYTCSLYKTSNEKHGNHPNLLMFDEPKQQDLSINDFTSFLKELATYKNAQTLLFASFENSDETFEKATSDIEFHLNYIDEKLIKPIE